MAFNGLMVVYLISSGEGGFTGYLTGDFIFSFFWTQTLATQELEANLALKEILYSSSQCFISTKDTLGEPWKFGNPAFVPLKPHKLRISAGETKGADVCIFHHKDGHIPGHTASRCKGSSPFPCSHKLLSAPKSSSKPMKSWLESKH